MSIANSLGALLIGCMCAIAVWGISSFQTYTYFAYPSTSVDGNMMRMLIVFLWALDTFHTILASHVVYYYAIVRYGEVEALFGIIWSLPLTITVTSVITLAVHIFFARRIYIISKGNKVIPFLITFSAIIRLGFALATTIQAYRLKMFARIINQGAVRWGLTTGLFLGAISDAFIAVCSYYFLARSRTGFATMDKIITSLQRYLLQTGALTTLMTGFTAICATAMPHNFVWIGSHFVISKLYLASLVAALNTRDLLREAHADPEFLHANELKTLRVAVSHNVLRDTGDNKASNRYNNTDPQSKSPTLESSRPVSDAIYLQETSRRQSKSHFGNFSIPGMFRPLSTSLQKSLTSSDALEWDSTSVDGRESPKAPAR